MQLDIMKFGSVVVAFEVFADFSGYKSGILPFAVTGLYVVFTEFLIAGIYQHKTGNSAGGHAMRAIGWGEEKGTAYWLIANSWGSGWGEKGYIRFLRGSNHCGIEGYVSSGLPK